MSEAIFFLCKSPYCKRILFYFMMLLMPELDSYIYILYRWRVVFVLVLVLGLLMTAKPLYAQSDSMVVVNAEIRLSNVEDLSALDYQVILPVGAEVQMFDCGGPAYTSVYSSGNRCVAALLQNNVPGAVVGLLQVRVPLNSAGIGIEGEYSNRNGQSLSEVSSEVISRFPGDLDGNKIVNMNDLSIFMAYYGKLTGTVNNAFLALQLDFTGDGMINIWDLSRFIKFYGSQY